MSEALKSGAQKLGSVFSKVLSPSYYKSQFREFSKYYYWKYIRPGSAAPLAHLMIFTGCAGYAMEYYALGRHHVAHKREIVEKALKEHGEHH